MGPPGGYNWTHFQHRGSQHNPNLFLSIRHLDPSPTLFPWLGKKCDPETLPSCRLSNPRGCPTPTSRLLPSFCNKKSAMPYYSDSLWLCHPRQFPNPSPLSASLFNYNSFNLQIRIRPPFHPRRCPRSGDGAEGGRLPHDHRRRHQAREGGAGPTPGC